MFFDKFTEASSEADAAERLGLRPIETRNANCPQHYLSSTGLPLLLIEIGEITSPSDLLSFLEEEGLA